MWNKYKVLDYARQIEKATHSKDPAVAEKAEFDLGALADDGFLDDTHCVMTSDTHLNFLADWIDLHYATYSPGDLLLELGSQGMIYSPFIWAFVVIGKLRKHEDRY